MKKRYFVSFIFMVFVSCAGNDKESSAASADDLAQKENAVLGRDSTTKHVVWEIGDPGHVDKILSLYQLWDEKKPFVTTDYFADTLRLHIPEVRKEIVLAADKIPGKLVENRDLYHATSNDIMSSVALRDKVTGENWVMITAFSKWTEKDGTKDSVLYHDDWRLTKDGKIDLLISFFKQPPKGFKINKNK